MSRKFFLFIVMVYCSFNLCTCCPPAYAHCASENNTCSLSNPGVIAYGADGFRWGYLSLSFNASFTCNNRNLGDPVIGIAKECCYQWPGIAIQPTHPWTWVAGYTSCNERTYSYILSQAGAHIWTFRTTVTDDVTFTDCGSVIQETQMYLFDHSGNDITNGSVQQPSECSNSLQQTFTYHALSPGWYYLQFKTLTGPGNYGFSLTCPGHNDDTYRSNILNCQENTTSGFTSRVNNNQYFHINIEGKRDVRFESCGSNYDTALYVYSDSLYENELVGGDNDACSEGNQEIYELAGLDPGQYYVRLQGVFTSGQYVFSIICGDTTQTSLHPTSKPTPSPTYSPTYKPTFPPTLRPSLFPSAHPTQVTQPTPIPTKSPTNARTTSSTNTVLISMVPSVSPTYPPIFYETDDGVGPIRWDRDPMDDTKPDAKANSVLIVVIILGVLICCGFIIITFLRGERVPKQLSRKRKKKAIQIKSAWEDAEGAPDEPTLPRARTYERVKSHEAKQQQVELRNKHMVQRMDKHMQPIHQQPIKQQQRMPVEPDRPFIQPDRPQQKQFVIKVDQWQPVRGAGVNGINISEMSLPNLP